MQIKATITTTYMSEGTLKEVQNKSIAGGIRHSPQLENNMYICMYTCM